jgi:protein-S-isoprenylcysteine O-methyltransferase Ste14
VIVLRHMRAILLLPFLVVAVVPYWLLTSMAAIDTRWGSVSPMGWFLRSAGVAVFICGLALFSWCVSLFARVGQGTLAPWDPTRKMVAVGPYRYVRNPMISGVATMLVGEALIWGSWVMGLWASVFVLVNHAYFVLSEEPGLERRFGERYLIYKVHVPRWIPRLKPWAG